MNKIAYIGAHGSGKTTTCNRLDTLFDDINISHALVIEKARLCPMPLDTFEGQMWLMNEQMKDEATWENKLGYDDDAVLICDRSIWDSLVYATYLFRQGKLSPQALGVIDDMATRWATSNPYSFIYLCEPKELYPDPKRPVDEAYQEEIYKIFKEIIKERGIVVKMVQ
jgi:hypothetical protein